jgi:lactoylglutathione lyase
MDNINFRMHHNNINVSNLQTSIEFYKQALGLYEKRRKTGADFVIVYLGNDQAEHLLELTWVARHPHKYDLGENEIHFAFVTADYQAALAKHTAMDIVCYNNEEFGIYFIVDPDGYWIEIMPVVNNKIVWDKANHL